MSVSLFLLLPSLRTSLPFLPNIIVNRGFCGLADARSKACLRRTFQRADKGSLRMSAVRTHPEPSSLNRISPFESMIGHAYSLRESSPPLPLGSLRQEQQTPISRRAYVNSQSKLRKPKTILLEPSQPGVPAGSVALHNLLPVGSPFSRVRKYNKPPKTCLMQQRA